MGHGHGLDRELLWLWHRLAATAQIRPLAWEFLYAKGVALKRKERKKITHYYHLIVNSRNCKFLLGVRNPF